MTTTDPQAPQPLLDPDLDEELQRRLAERRQAVMVDGDGVADFSKKTVRPKFRIDDDMFEGARGLPAGTILEFMDLADKWQRANPDQALPLLKSLFEMVLLPASYERFTARLTDRENPIDIDQVGDIIVWLLEKYGVRPTEPSPSSSDGSVSPVDGMSSTVDPLSGVLTSGILPSTDS